MTTVPHADRNPTLKYLAGTQPPPIEPDLGTAPRLIAAGRTDTGEVRDKNEDQFLIAETNRVVKIDASSFAVGEGVAWPVLRQARIMMVADGIGGHAHGEIASAVAVDAMLDAVASMRDLSRDDEAALGAELQAAVGHAQTRVFTVASRKALHFKPGTTLTMAYIDWPDLYVVHVGDSRCYLVREGNILQLTQDHTLAAQLVEAGLTPEQADQSRGRHVLLNAVGGGTEDLRVDVQHRRLLVGDKLLLCTDGLHDLVGDDRILATVDGTDDPVQATHGLVEAALAAGGTDNVTAVMMIASP